MVSLQQNHVDPHSGFCSATGIYHSKHEPVSLPIDPFCSSVGLLLANRDFDHLTAYVDGSSGWSVTYKEFRERVNVVAAGLVDFGVRQGDVVLLLLPNSIHYCVIVMGVMLCGAVITTCNPVNTQLEIAKQVKDSGTKFICASPAVVEKVNGCELPLILVEDDNAEGVTSLATSRGCTTLTKLLQSDSARFSPVPIRQDDVAALLYSSGTTGMTKGVIITHRNLIAQRLVSFKEDGTPWTDIVFLCALPMFHVYGLTFFATGVLSKGSTTVIMPKFDMVQMLELIQRYRVTLLPIVPPILIALAKLKIVEKYDLSSLQLVVSGAAPLSQEVKSAFHARFPNVPILQGYGLTESTSIGISSTTEEECQHRGAIGLIASNTEAKIVDIVSGSPLAPNKKGEIWLRGPTIMKGYFGNPGETATTVDSEGWLHTGDLGFIDEEGYAYVVDRLKELIKYKGFQVAPAELEAVLLSHPEVLDAAVIPFPDVDAGQIPVACILRFPGSALTEDDVIKFVAKKVAPYKRVRHVVFVSSIPKSASGKILRRYLTTQVISKL